MKGYKNKKGELLATTIQNNIEQTQLLHAVVTCNVNITNDIDSQHTIFQLLNNNSNITTPTNTRTVKCLLDTGALQDNYVSEKLAAWMESVRSTPPSCSLDCVCDQCRIEKPSEGNNIYVNAGFGGATTQSIKSPGFIKFSLHMLNEVNQQIFSIQNMQANVLPSDFDIIIGRPMIQKLDLTRWFPSHFRAPEILLEKTYQTLGDDSLEATPAIRVTMPTGVMQELNGTPTLHSAHTLASHCPRNQG